MSKYIEFTTSADNPHTVFSLGNPVHDGQLPSRFGEVVGVRVDGEDVEFVDEGIPERLHRVLLEQSLRRPMFRRNEPSFDCVAFAAAMYGIPLVGARRGMVDNPFQNALANESVDCLDSSTTAPINLGVGMRRLELYMYRHTVVPAHSPDTAQYLHKLGDERPVCLSGLAEAMRMFKCNVAHSAILSSTATHNI